LPCGHPAAGDARGHRLHRDQPVEGHRLGGHRQAPRGSVTSSPTRCPTSASVLIGHQFTPQIRYRER
jgi:hypothetical protein